MQLGKLQGLVDLRNTRYRSVKGLYPKTMLLVGGAFMIMMVATMTYVTVSSSRQLEREWLDRAETLNRMAYETLYTSLEHGGGREGNRQVITRLEDVGVFTHVRVVTGDSVIEEYGPQLVEFPQDGLERRAMTGEHVGEVSREDGFKVVRYATPLRMAVECQQCHQADVGAISGVISTEISLRDYELSLRQRRNLLLAGLGGGLLALGLLTFYALRRLVLRPLQAIQEGTAAMAEGDLDRRLAVRTGDELEGLANALNHMAQSLQESYGKVAEEQNKVVAALEASRDAIWVCDTGRRVVLVNSALERLLGQGRDEILGKTCLALPRFHDANGSALCETACAMRRPVGNNSGRVDALVSGAQGREVWVEIGYGRVTDHNGKVAGMVHIARDLTERKEIERMKDDFIAMVSHELRTPLNHIKGFASTLLQTDVEWDTATQRDFLGSINREADRLSSLVEKILQLSQLEAGALPLDREWHQANDLVEWALQRRRSLVAGRRVELRLSENLPPLCVDGRQIEVVLINLIENAVKYSDASASITLATEVNDGQVLFTVSDRGVGIPAEYQERIFERFYRVQDERNRFPGTGLGLAICRHIVEAHGGQIWVESAPGVGSHVHFCLSAEGDDDPTGRPDCP